MAIRVVVVDDHAVVRSGIKLLLDRHDDIEVVGEAGNGQDAVFRVRELIPDVILLDLVMPAMSGHELLAELRRHPLTTHIPVVIATGANPTESDRRELAQRASAILLKAELSRHTLPDIVRTALGRAI